jgi:hypothetical protein
VGVRVEVGVGVRVRVRVRARVRVGARARARVRVRARLGRGWGSGEARAVEHVEDGGGAGFPEGEAVRGPMLLEQADDAAHEAAAARAHHLGRAPRDVRVAERLAVVVVHLEVEVDEGRLRELGLERRKLVGGHLCGGREQKGLGRTG